MKHALLVFMILALFPVFAVSQTNYATMHTGTLTTGSIPFVTGTHQVGEDNVNLLWDNTNKLFRGGPPLSSYSSLIQSYSFTGNILGSLNAGSGEGMLALNQRNGAAASGATFALYGLAESTHTSGTSAQTRAIEGDAYHTGTGGTVTTLAGLTSYAETQNGTVTSQIGVHATANVKSGGTVGANYGIKVENQAVAGATNYAIQTGSGQVNLGDVLVLPGVTIANLPAAPAVGMIIRVTDSLAPVIGNTVAAGGAAAALIWYNGAAWTVIGK